MGGQSCVNLAFLLGEKEDVTPPIQCKSRLFASCPVFVTVDNHIAAVTTLSALAFELAAVVGLGKYKRPVSATASRCFICARLKIADYTLAGLYPKVRIFYPHDLTPNFT